MTITEARSLGYVRGARIAIGNDMRTMTSNRIMDFNGNLLAWGNSPFWIFQLGHWCGRILKTTSN